MSTEIPHEDAATAQKPVLLRIVHGSENWLISAVLLAMVVLPLADIVARKMGTYVPNGSLLLQNCTLIVSILGALVAARERRMLALSSVQGMLGEKAKPIAEAIAGGVGGGIAFLLAAAGLVCVQQSWKDNDAVLAFGIKTLWVQSCLPAGFLLIGLRLCWQSGTTWRVRAGAAALALLITLVVAPSDWKLPLSVTEPHAAFWALLGTLIVGTLLGAPVFATLGGLALLLFWKGGQSIADVEITHYELVKSELLPTLPLFTLAGYFMAEGGSAPRIVRLFDALVGSLRGGPAFVTALACAYFTAFTGASGVTILAIGGLMMPVLLRDGCRQRAALGYVTGAGSLGMLWQPCLPLVLYAIKAQQEPEQMFRAGYLPGLLLLLLTAIYGVAHRAGQDEDGRAVLTGTPRARAVWDAKWDLLVPFVAIVPHKLGWTTIVESASLTAVYALLLVTVLRRGLDVRRELPRVLAECGLMVGGVILILGVANAFTEWLIGEEVPALATHWVKAHISSPLLFLLALNGLMLIVGCLMDVFSAIIVVVPLILPMAVPFGIDPLHLGIVILANLELGYLTPPIGLNLFLASYRFKKPLPEVYRAAVPMIVVLGIGVLVITYVPWLSTWLPRTFGR